MKDPLEFSDLNVFIGPNGAGKSNLIEAISLLPDALRSGLGSAIRKRNGSFSILNKNTDADAVKMSWHLPDIPDISQGIDINYSLKLQPAGGAFEVSSERLEEIKPRRNNELRSWLYLDFAFGKGRVNRYEKGKYPIGLEEPVMESEDQLYSFDIALRGISMPSNYPAVHWIKTKCGSWQFYNGNNMDIGIIRKQPAVIDPEPLELSANGENLAIVLYNLISRDETGLEENIHRILKALYDDFEYLKFPLIDSTHIDMKWKSRRWKKQLTMKELSDGTIRMLCWIAILTQPNPPSLICIDEPEIGLHPAWMPILADLIKDAAQKTQVMVVTHSPDLLDGFSSTPQYVIVTEADENGTADFKKLDIDELDNWLVRYRLGELYRRKEPVVGGWPH